MRITKKFAGASCIGKQVFQPCENTQSNMEIIGKIDEELKDLEVSFLDRLANKSTITSPFGVGIDDEISEISPKIRFENVNKASGSHHPSVRLGNSSRLNMDFVNDRKIGGNPKRINSAPDMIQLAAMHARVAAGGPLMKRQRSHSVMDLEHYTADDQAAGKIYLHFFYPIYY